MTIHDSLDPELEEIRVALISVAKRLHDVEVKLGQVVRGDVQALVHDHPDQIKMHAVTLRPYSEDT